MYILEIYALSLDVFIWNSFKVTFITTRFNTVFLQIIIIHAVYVHCLPHHKYMPLISNTSGKRKYLSLLFLFNCRVRNALTLNSLGYEMPGVRNAWGTKSLGYETPSTKRLVTKRLGYETFGTRAVDVSKVNSAMPAQVSSRNAEVRTWVCYWTEDYVTRDQVDPFEHWAVERWPLFTSMTWLNYAMTSATGMTSNLSRCPPLAIVRDISSTVTLRSLLL